MFALLEQKLRLRIKGFKKFKTWVKTQDNLTLLWIHLLRIIQVIYVIASKHCPSSLFSSVQFSRSVMSDSLWPHGLQHARPPCPSPTPGVYSNSCPLSRWCHPTMSSSVVPFSSCPQSFPASGSFQRSQFFASVAKVLEFQPQHQSSLLL